MSEINVLVSSNSTSKVKSSSVSNEGNSVTDNSAAMEFAAIFGGWMAQAIGQGQDSGLQSNNPAGKEANSGQRGIQGLEGMLGSLRTIAGLSGSISGNDQQAKEAITKAIGMDLMTLLSQNNLLGDVADTGIGSGQPQGDKSSLTELDQYKVLITQLLQDMSGEINKVSYKSADIEGILNNISQSFNLKSNFSTNINESKNLTQIFAEENPQLSVGRSRNTQDVQPLQSKGPSLQQESVNSMQVAGVSANQKIGDSAQFILTTRNPQQQNLYEYKNSPLNQNQNNTVTDDLSVDNNIVQVKILSEENHAGNGEQKGSENSYTGSTKASGVENTNSPVGNTNLSNVAFNSVLNVTNKSDQILTTPVWLQVAQGLKEKVLYQLPTVRELNIQLHPAELGQIRISLTWDNGQIHMNIHASETATGQALQSNFPELREALSQSGVQCGTMQMGYSDSNRNFGQGRNQTLDSKNKKQDKQNANFMEISETKEAVILLDNFDQETRQNSRINVTA